MKSVIIVLFLIFSVGLSFISGDTNLKKENMFFFEGHTHIGLLKKGNKISLEDYNYYSDRKVDAIIFNLPVLRSSTPNLLRRIEKEILEIKRSIKKMDTIGLAFSEKDYLINYSKNKKSIGLAIEYFKGIFNKDESRVEKYYKLGIRMICLVNNQYDKFFIRNGNREVLNEFGKKIILEMNKWGIIIDITHLKDNQKLEVIRFSKKPVIASHSNPRGPAPSNFNVSDVVIRNLKNRGGLFLISIGKNDLYPDKNKVGSGVDGVVTHLNYLKKLIGINQIGIGTDLQSNGRYVPSDLRGKDCFQKIVNGLKTNGYSNDAIKKIMGRNLLKFLATGGSPQK